MIHEMSAKNTKNTKILMPHPIGGVSFVDKYKLEKAGMLLRVFV